MSRRSRAKLIRIWHRRLAPLIGIQLLLWSLGGVYFSWGRSANDLRDSEISVTESPDLKYENFLALLPPLIRNSELSHIRDIQLGKLLNTPVYRLIQDDSHAETYNAISGELLSPIDETTAAAVAAAEFGSEVAVKQMELIEEQNGSYRGPIPAWKVTFDDWKASVIYVASGTGSVTYRSSAILEACGILWWLPVGNDPAGDATQTWIVRVTSVLGVVTVAAGFYLWYLTLSLKRKAKPKKSAGKKQGKAK